MKPESFWTWVRIVATIIILVALAVFGIWYEIVKFKFFLHNQ